MKDKYVPLDERELSGHCEGCQSPIYEDEPRYVWEDGIITCEKCGGGHPTKHKMWHPKEEVYAS